MKNIFYFIILLFLVVSCKEKNTISLVSYNAQTFFDLVNDGREFKEFQNRNWNEASYNERINRLLEAVKICSNELVEKEDLPDILVLQEIESVEVIKDISKRLTNNIYKQAVFATKENNSPFNTVIFSKHKILHAKAHNVYFEEKSLRPIIEADLLALIGGKEIKMTVFAVHWKSKRDGNKNIRKMQEELLYNRMKEKEKISDFVIACGDFNQGLHEFSKMKTFNNAWDLYKKEVEEENIDAEYESVEGSYCYKGKWEKIDHIFYSNNSKLKPSFFTVAAKAPLVYKDKINRYNIGTKVGYSDHLPIGFLLEL
ncbi:MAG: endonuclease/exonuclease/phosphatase family protein [Treponema sp.]